VAKWPSVFTKQMRREDDEQRFGDLVKERESRIADLEQQAASPVPEAAPEPPPMSGFGLDTGAVPQPAPDPGLGGGPSPAPEADDDWIGTMMGGRASDTTQPSVPTNADAPLGSPPGQANDSTDDDWIGTMMGGGQSSSDPAVPGAPGATPRGDAPIEPSMAGGDDLAKLNADVARRYPDLAKTDPVSDQSKNLGQSDDLAKLNAHVAERYPGISDGAMRKATTGEPAPKAEDEPQKPLNPDLPGLRLPGGPIVMPGKATQNPDEARRKILAGEPLTAQDFVGQFANQAQNQMSSTPAALEGAVPGRGVLGATKEDLGLLGRANDDLMDLGGGRKGPVDLATMDSTARRAAGYAGKALGEAAPAAEEAAPARRFFHGTGSAFDKPDGAKFDENGLYGPGYYLTDDARVASSYATGKENTASALEADLATWRGELETPGLSERRAYMTRNRIADIERQLADAPSVGPNVRAVDAPENLTLLDADAPATVDDVKRVAAVLSPEDQTYFLNGIKPRVRAGEATGQDIYEWTSNAVLDPKKTNDVLAAAGYDGVRYAGGKRVPLKDEAGAPIEHTAVAIFPESLPKLRNAISGTQGGIVDRSLDKLTGLKAPAAENLAGAGLGAVGGDIAATDEDTPQQRAERVAAGALLGGTAVTAGKRLSKGKSALPDVAGERLGVGPSSSYEPPRSDFAAWMQWKKDQLSGQEARPTSRQPIGKKAEEDYYRKADDLGIGALDETGEARARGTDLNMLDEERDLTGDDLARFGTADDFASVARVAIEPRAPRSAADLVASGRALTDTLQQRESEAARAARELAEKPEPPTPLIEKVQAYRYANMLSDWSARTADVISGGVESVARPTGMFLSGAVLPNKTGRARMGAAAADVASMLHALPEGLRAGLDTLVTGRQKFGNTRAGGEAEGKLGTLGRVLTPARDLMQAADDAVKTVNFAGAYASEARVLANKNGTDLASLMQNPTPELLERTMQRVNSVTYSDDLTGLPKVLQKIPREAGWEGVAFSLVMPFVRVSANITKGGTVLLGRGMGAGLVEAGVRGLKGDSEGARHALGQTALGASVLAGSAYLASQGRLTGSGPTDPTKRAQLQATGWQPNSYFDGERYHDVKNLLGRFAFPVLAVANAWETVLERAGEKGKTIASPEDVAEVLDAETVSRLVGHTAAALTDMNYLRPLRDMFVNAERGGAGRVLEGLATNVIASFVPLSGALAHVERVTDPTERSTETVADRVKGRVPGLSGTVPAEPDIYGRTRTRPEGDTVAQIMLPWRSTPKRTDPVAAEVARLTQAGQDVGVRRIGKEYAGVKQQPETRRAIQTELGNAARVYILQTIADPEYALKSDEGKAKTLSKQIALAYKLADAGLDEKVERTPAGKALLAYNAIPHYKDIEDNQDPAKIRRANMLTAEAVSLRNDYRQKYKDPREADARFAADFPAQANLARRPKIDSDYLKRKRAQIKTAMGADVPEEDQPILGAGNRIAS
jgi:hypothetical protein